MLKLPTIPKLPQLPKLPPRDARVSGSLADGYVQVLAMAHDDATAKLLMQQAGVEFAAASMIPLKGVLILTITTDNKCRYCWRC